MPKPLSVVVRTSITLSVVAIVCALAVLASEPLKKVPPGISWRAAVGMGSGWNREQFIGPILNGRPIEGMPRTRVLELFGNPGYSSTDYPGTTRIDQYRLSAKNDRTFRIDYDREGKVTGDSIEDGPCDCPICRADSPSVSIETIRKAGLLQQREFIDGSLTVGKLEAQLGQPGSWSAGNSTAGQQVWFGFSDTWRITGGQATPDEYFIADGHTPFLNYRRLGSEKRLAVDSWAVVTFAPGCLTK
jgi:hypothetical protein